MDFDWWVCALVLPWGTISFQTYRHIHSPSKESVSPVCKNIPHWRFLFRRVWNKLISHKSTQEPYAGIVPNCLTFSHSLNAHLFMNSRIQNHQGTDATESSCIDAICNNEIGHRLHIHGQFTHMLGRNRWLSIRIWARTAANRFEWTSRNRCRKIETGKAKERIFSFDKWQVRDWHATSSSVRRCRRSFFWQQNYALKLNGRNETSARCVLIGDDGFGRTFKKKKSEN